MKTKIQNKPLPIIDPYFLLVFFILLGFGLVMVTSASIGVAEKKLGSAFYYTIRHGINVFVGLLMSLFLVFIPAKFWYKVATPIFFLSLLTLVCVLLPGIGHEVNGSTRWINLGFTNIQVSEFAKFGVILYVASYMIRHEEAVTKKISGFFRPMLLLTLMSILLLLEPDFGATIVIMSTAIGMLFLGGVPKRYFLALVLFMASALLVIAVSAPYRLQRLTSFLDPWANQFDSGYQLTQALIAFGRGEWFGVGLGSSVQKLFYLPEAHTDFIFAVIAEELGLLGVLSVMGLYAFITIKGMKIGLGAQKRQDLFASFVCYGITMWVSLQALINVGVNTGVLPTKGLTLPFLSYGGSSILILCVAMSLLFRIDFENRSFYNKELGF